MKLKQLLILLALFGSFLGQTAFAEEAPPPNVPPAPESAKPKSNEPFNLCDFKMVTMEEIFTAATKNGTQMGELEQITTNNNGKEEVIGVVFEKLVAFYQPEVGEKLLAQCKRDPPTDAKDQPKTAI